MFVCSPISLRMLAIGILILSSAGCSTLKLSPVSTGLGQDPLKTSVEQSAVPAATCQVEVRSRNGQVQRRQVPITDGMSVQEVLVAVRAEQIFPRILVELQRSTGKSQRPVKMPVRYQRSNKQVNPAYNYAIREGDCLVIKEDPSNALDDMLEAVLSPLGVTPGQHK